MSIIANPMLNGDVIRLDGAIRMAPRQNDSCWRRAAGGYHRRTPVRTGSTAPYAPDETFPVSDIFPTGNKTPFYGMVVVQSGGLAGEVLLEYGRE